MAEVTPERKLQIEQIRRQLQQQMEYERQKRLAEEKARRFLAQPVLDPDKLYDVSTNIAPRAPQSVHRRPMEWSYIAGVSKAHVAKWVEAYVECKPAEYVRGVVSWENGGGGLMRYIDHPDHLRGLAPGKLCIVMGRGIPKQLVEVEEQAERSGWHVDVVNRPSRQGARTVFPDEAYGLNFTEAVLGEFKTPQERLR